MEYRSAEAHHNSEQAYYHDHDHENHHFYNSVATKQATRSYSHRSSAQPLEHFSNPSCQSQAPQQTMSYNHPDHVHSGQNWRSSLQQRTQALRRETISQHQSYHEAHQQNSQQSAATQMKMRSHQLCGNLDDVRWSSGGGDAGYYGQYQPNHGQQSSYNFASHNNPQKLYNNNGFVVSQPRDTNVVGPSSVYQKRSPDQQHSQGLRKPAPETTQAMRQAAGLKPNQAIPRPMGQFKEGHEPDEKLILNLLAQAYACENDGQHCLTGGNLRLSVGAKQRLALHKSGRTSRLPAPVQDARANAMAATLASGSLTTTSPAQLNEASSSEENSSMGRHPVQVREKVHTRQSASRSRPRKKHNSQRVLEERTTTDTGPDSTSSSSDSATHSRSRGEHASAPQSLLER